MPPFGCIDVVYIICSLIWVREWESCFQSRLCSLTCRLYMLVFESCRTQKHWLHLSQHTCSRVTEQAEAARPVCCPIALLLKASVHYVNTKICALYGIVCVCVHAKCSLVKRKWSCYCPIIFWLTRKSSDLLEGGLQFLNTFCEFA